MENHPIPQDVTGFKFKLIGSVTIKQFLYLLGFGILTTAVFMIQMNFFIKLPLMIMFAGIGAALAFLPIEGRPMDIMIANFAKSIPAENRYIYKKRGADINAFDLFMPPKTIAHPTTTAQNTTTKNTQSTDKKALLISKLRNSSFQPDARETQTLKNIDTYFKNSDATVPVMKTPLPVIEVAQATQDEEKYNAIEEKVKAIEVAEQEAEPQQQAPVAAATVAAPAAPAEPQPQIEVSSEERTVNTTVNVPNEDIQQKPNPTLAAGFPTLPDVPNVMLGIVRDPRGKSLPNILVEVTDTNGLPVRAFKTSPLGQFASATPLPKGTYAVSFEDPQKHHEFAKIEVKLDDTIFQPLEITSVDDREKLRRELFGGGQATAA